MTPAEVRILFQIKIKSPMKPKIFSLLAVPLILGLTFSFKNNESGVLRVDKSILYSGGGFCSNKINLALLRLDTGEKVAPLFDQMGNHSYTIHTIAPMAQQYFDQGLKFIYGFNHGEAYRSFKECLKIDPYCAMAYWGIAMSLGPNLNDWVPSKAREQEAHEALATGKDLAKGSQKELDLIMALAQRHADSTSVNRDSLNRTYMEAMKSLTAKYPDDLEIKTLYVDAIMNTMPWNYYEKDKSPRSNTTDAVKLLEEVIRKNPFHPGAHHLYIHIVEASDNPDRGVPSADMLGSLIPAAGHLVHMPAHIYARVGRYEDAAQSNRKAIQVDEDYLAACQAMGIYPLGYYPHNIHFLWMSATLSGRMGEALDAAEKVADKIPLDVAAADLLVQGFLPVTLQAYVRFGKWNQILTTPAPDARLTLVKKFWHHARSIAFARKGLFDQAQAEIDSLERMIRSEQEGKESSEETPDSAYDMMDDIHELLRLVPMSELAAAQGHYPEAIAHLRTAVEKEDNLPYNEPPNWHHPVRQVLGKYLLEAGEYKEAEQVFREDLKNLRDNGWSLFGLSQALKMAGKEEEARQAYKAYQKAWVNADFTLASPAF
jgi:tetratricopeptide (TPR) repeat protein